MKTPQVPALERGDRDMKRPRCYLKTHTARQHYFMQLGTLYGPDNQLIRVKCSRCGMLATDMPVSTIGPVSDRDGRITFTT